MHLKPLNKKLVIKRISRDQKKNSLILLNKEDQYEKHFEVISLSDDCSDGVAIGDKVIIDRYSNHAVQGDEDLFIVREENVIGVYQN